MYNHILFLHQILYMITCRNWCGAVPENKEFKRKEDTIHCKATNKEEGGSKAKATEKVRRQEK